MLSQSRIKQYLEENPDKKDKLFCRGFYFTNKAVRKDTYPFYNLWNETIIGRYQLLVSPKQKYTIYNGDRYSFIMVGHAYDPIAKVYDETAILENLANVYDTSFFEKFNDLTGVFSLIITDNKSETIKLLGDATCMQNNYYLCRDNGVYISSHSKLLSDVLNLSDTPYVQHLTRYKFYPLFGNYLPGNIAQIGGGVNYYYPII